MGCHSKRCETLLKMGEIRQKKRAPEAASGARKQAEENDQRKSTSRP